MVWYGMVWYGMVEFTSVLGGAEVVNRSQPVGKRQDSSGSYFWDQLKTATGDETKQEERYCCVFYLKTT